MAGSKLLPCTVFIMNMVAIGLAIFAEFKRKKGRVVVVGEMMYSFCEYGSNIASILGTIAFLIHMASQILIAMVSRHFFFRKQEFPDERSRKVAISLFTTCWIFFVAAEVCLLFGCVRNGYRTKYKDIFFMYDAQCVLLRRGVFAGGACLIFLTTLIFELFYIRYSNHIGLNNIQPSDTKIGDFDKAEMASSTTTNQGNH